ncbi:DUF1056 family protein [Fructobacillus sp. CRL 2054]|uniref:DUF1056 family protein n=1 Tax=Fructobacillus sp. CRL 2054 TaxID=2763007 RepID=UPI0023785539|nr:DUF1056 family protein [Fructobacillus sp. CRL 2054]MDD9139146.1 DUF1056 family protein [Fructobacillus sp. CRL 2054]
MVKQLLTLIWGYFDVIFFGFFLIFGNLFAYSFGIRWFWLSFAITSILIALASEMLASVNEGGKN